MSPNSGPGNGWNEWSRHILKELERLNECYDKLDGRLRNIEQDMAMLKVKSGVWGATGAALVIVGQVLIKALK